MNQQIKVADLREALASVTVCPDWPVLYRDSKGQYYDIKEIRIFADGKDDIWMVLADDPS